MAYDAIKYSNEYSKTHYRSYNFRVSLEMDEDIIRGIEEMRNMGVPANAFIRESIRDALQDEQFLNDTIAKVESIKRGRI